MKRGLFLIAGILLTFNIQAVQTGDCTAGTQYCEQNSLGTTNSTTTVNTNTNNNTNNNTNINTNTNTNTNNNTNTNTSTNTNSNTNVNTSTSTASSTVNSTVSQTATNTNNNNNINSTTANNTNTNSNTNNNNNTSTSTQTVRQEVKSPPASAIAPSIMSYSQDLCTTGVSGAFQGQLFGLSGGKAVRDENCERLKLSKYLYDTGMKVAAVSILCQDSRVFKAMSNAGTPCPYKGKIGEEAKIAWANNVEETPTYKEDLKSYVNKCTRTKTIKGISKSSRTCKKEFHSKNN
jgi:hypothetical protein